MVSLGLVKVNKTNVLHALYIFLPPPYVEDMVVPQGSNLVCTSDRDHKVRVSNLPTSVSVMGGANEIQSFCYGGVYGAVWASILTRL